MVYLNPITTVFPWNIEEGPTTYQFSFLDQAKIDLTSGMALQPGATLFFTICNIGGVLFTQEAFY